jgi:hypothetical protein
MFDIKQIITEATGELAAEKATAAKSKIKAKLKQIADAERIVQNLRDEYGVLIRDLG